MDRIEEERAHVKKGPRPLRLSWRRAAVLLATSGVVAYFGQEQPDGDGHSVSNTSSVQQASVQSEFESYGVRQASHQEPNSPRKSLGRTCAPRLRHQQDDYVVEPPDVLRIEITSHEPLPEALAGTSGQYLIDADGNLALPGLAATPVGGLTLAAVRTQIASALKLDDAVKLNVTVDCSNSKVYYLIQTEPGGCDSVKRMPLLADETVRNALEQISPELVANRSVWIARLGSGSSGQDQILPVNVADLLSGDDMATNYPLQPGDRIFVAEEPGLLEKLWEHASRHWSALGELW